MNPYRQFVSSFSQLGKDGQALPLGNIPAPSKPKLPPNAPVALIFSPHPDDECIIGGLALRLMREAKWRIVNVAVTLGSNLGRRQDRLKELQAACEWIGFDLDLPAAHGLDKVNPDAHANDPAGWNDAVRVIIATLKKYQPRAIFFPHELDWNRTHIGTHLLVMDALKTLPADRQLTLIETEFWGQMPSPNSMVESSAEDVADLVAALSHHVGEVRRNPYHLRLPAWMLDNVRRGAELVDGQGSPAPDFTFATLYRIRRWRAGRLEDIFSHGKQTSRNDPVENIFGEA